MRTNNITERLARTERLRQGRQRDSEAKRAAATVAPQNLVSAGIRVTVARVAREANVSEWLVRNVPEILEAVHAAMHTQQQDGIAPAPARTVKNDETMASIRTDLALTQQANRELRAENAALKKRLESALGVEAEGVTATELAEHLHELERINHDLAQKLRDSEAKAAALTTRSGELEADLEGKQEALRQLMFSVNTTKK